MLVVAGAVAVGAVAELVSAGVVVVVLLPSLVVVVVVVVVADWSAGVVLGAEVAA
ncbi:MAG: hypothetical protein JO149_00990 [Gammaproteobacteria bacterium]|nr:hypothetical protein [Gammaproteobacteria bacterium]